MSGFGSWTFFYWTSWNHGQRTNSHASTSPFSHDLLSRRGESWDTMRVEGSNVDVIFFFGCSLWSCRRASGAGSMLMQGPFWAVLYILKWSCSKNSLSKQKSKIKGRIPEVHQISMDQLLPRPGTSIKWCEKGPFWWSKEPQELFQCCAKMSCSFPVAFRCTLGPVSWNHVSGEVIFLQLLWH